MNFYYFKHKLTYVSHNNAKSISTNLAHEIKTFFNTNQSSQYISKALLNTLTLDLTYSFLKNLRWHRLDLFKKIIIDMLITEYNLKEEYCKKLFNSIKTKLTPYLDDKHKEDKEDFLRYIFIATATAKDENKLIIDLGLGENILKKVKKAAELIANTNSPKTTEQAVFANNLDAAFMKIITDISIEAKQTPWIIDIYRLKYILESSNWDNIIDITSFIFDLLLTIGKQKYISEKKIEQLFLAKLNNIIKKSYKNNKEKNISDLIKLLQDKKLIFSDTIKNKSATKWRLTPLSEEITALAFAEKYFSEIEMSDILSLCPSYQEAIIKNTKNINILKQLLENHSNNLSPKGLSACIFNLSRHIKSDYLLKQLKNILFTNKNPWLRQEACKLLAQIGDNIEQILAKIAVEDYSTYVKNTALDELIKRQKSDDNKH